MSNLFKKAALFTDLHYGAKSNSETHNRDCEKFINWFIDEAKKHGCDTCIFLGDYHNNRATMNLKTMDYAVRGLDKLGQHFQQTFFIPGNHDLFFKDQRSVHSTPWAKLIPNVTFIEKPTTIDHVTLCPWLVGDEWKTVGKKGGQYIFGHFELPSFAMNAMVQMPDHGEIQLEHFSKYELGFSGHFHKRQQRKNMIYIGNAFPHNYSDAWDDDRGMAILEWGGTPTYIPWPDQPTFRTLKLSRLIDEADTIIKPNQYLRVGLDIDVTFEEACFIKEKFMDEYAIRELVLIPEKKIDDGSTDLEVKSFESVNQIVSSQIINIQSETYDPKILLELYNSL
jgi:hypothetical protein